MSFKIFNQTVDVRQKKYYRFAINDFMVILETATRRCPGCMESTILSKWHDFRFQSKVGLFCTFGYLQLSIYLLTYMGVFDLAIVSSVLPQLLADCKKMGPPMKALSHRIVLIPFFARLATSSYLEASWSSPAGGSQTCRKGQL